SAKTERCLIEGLGKKNVLPNEDELAGRSEGNARVRPRAEAGEHPLRIQRPDLNLSIGTPRQLLGFASRLYPVKEAPAVGEETRESMRELPTGLVEGRSRRRRTTLGGQPKQRPSGLRRKEDPALCAPRAASPLGRNSEFQNSSTERVDLLQLSTREKRDETSLGRPEPRRALSDALTARHRLPDH